MLQRRIFFRKYLTEFSRWLSSQKNTIVDVGLGYKYDYVIPQFRLNLFIFQKLDLITLDLKRVFFKIVDMTILLNPTSSSIYVQHLSTCDWTLSSPPKGYSETYQLSKIESFAKILNGV